MSEWTLVAQRDAVSRRTRLPTAKLIGSSDDVSELYRQVARAVWVLTDSKPLMTLVQARIRPRRSRQLLVLLRSVSAVRKQVLQTYFQRVVSPDQQTQLLDDRDDLLEILTHRNPQDFMIGGAADVDARVLVLIRGNLDSFVVPFSWFRARRGGPRPKFEDFEIIDSGQTIRLGQYEASTDAVLYDHDRAYRLRTKANALEQDSSFGGALKRLRLLRGLSRGDFPDLSEKEIARIERGEVSRPHASTLGKLARALRVEPDEIATF